MSELTARIVGARHILNHANAATTVGPSFRQFLEKSALVLESQARRNAPKWRRVLMNSIESQIDNKPVPLEAKVGVLKGPALAYAAAMEYGWKPRRSGSFPPLAPIAEWARSKGVGIPAFVIARAIAQGRSRHQRMGGFKYLTRAFETSLPKIRGFLKDAARDIEKEWENRNPTS